MSFGKIVQVPEITSKSKMLNRLISSESCGAWKVSSDQLNSFAVDVDCSPLQHDFSLEIAALHHELLFHLLRSSEFFSENCDRVVNRLDFTYQSKLRLIATVLYTRTLVTVVETSVRNLHWVIHVFDGNLKLFNLNFRVSETSQALQRFD